ncbi:MAG: hypothetical protein HDR02_13575 [Lachnospiraceae bacterium]|nr:hypothetical protein [Lachnospiraceae bacterium]
MAKQEDPRQVAVKAEKNQIKNEKKQLKNEQKQQKKEARRRAKEIAKREDELADDDEGGGFATLLATIMIVMVWLAVIVVIIKLDVGGFGSKVLTPILQDVPVLNRILPGNSVLETNDPESYGGYTSLVDAVDYIKELELELERMQTSANAKDEEIAELKANVIRLQEFEQKQLDFQRIKNEFLQEVVYAENGPGPEEYRKFYEAADPSTAELLYRQVIIQQQETQEIQDFAATYSQMKPKQAAAIFENMTDELDVVARILKVMSAENRGSIMGVMDSEIAAKLTKIMDPES